MPSIARKILSALAIAAFLSAAPAAFAASSEAEADAKEAEALKEVVLRVNGADFTRANLETAVANLMPSASFHSSVSSERKGQMRKDAVNGMINDELIAGEAARDKAIADSITRKDVNKEIDGLEKKLPQGRTLKDVLKASKMSKGELKDYLRKKLQSKRYIEKKTEEFKAQAEATVTDAFMRDYYDKHLEKFEEPEQMRLRAILIKADPSGGNAVWEAARQKAKGLADRARGGEDFVKLAEQYSEDPGGAKNGGDMGWQHKGSFLEEIDAVADRMKTGEISEPIMTIYGYLVVKVEDAKPAVQKKYEELNTGGLKQELVAKERGRLAEKWIADMRSAAKIEYLAVDVKPAEAKPAEEKKPAEPEKEARQPAPEAKP
ncbi:MAG: peptidylprolyl isomerase [Deltaproteobacteria bacterium]|nr:peptidylprolyl isomerase [Deltaproteobacteria bacterium]